MPTPFSIIAVNLLRQRTISRYCRLAGMTWITAHALSGRVNSVATDCEQPAQHLCDSAVLNINLGQETAERVARRLTAADIPFITVSGYGQQPAVFSRPILSKPFDYRRLIERRGMWWSRATSDAFWL